MNNNIITKLVKYNSNEYKIIEDHTDNHRFLKKIQIKDYEPGLKTINIIMFNPSPIDTGKICKTIKIILDILLGNKNLYDFCEINITNLFSYKNSKIDSINISNIDYNNNQYLINEIEFNDYIILACGDYQNLSKQMRLEYDKQFLLINEMSIKFNKKIEYFDKNKNGSSRHASFYLRYIKSIKPDLWGN